MAERLTTRFHGILVKEADVSKIQVITKLGQLEDIMDKYGIESVEELDATLKMKTNSIKGFEKLEQDRNIWKRACELACRHIAEVEWLSCPETDDIKESENEIKTLTKQSLNYFYQQAKKEGENETA